MTLRNKPDCWGIIKIWNDKDKISSPIYKLLSSYGSHNKSWNLNSGIIKIERIGDTILFTGVSGSIREVHFNNYRMNAYLTRIFESFQEALSKDIHGNKICLLSEKEAYELCRTSKTLVIK